MVTESPTVSQRSMPAVDVQALAAAAAFSRMGFPAQPAAVPLLPQPVPANADQAAAILAASQYYQHYLQCLYQSQVAYAARAAPVSIATPSPGTPQLPDLIGQLPLSAGHQAAGHQAAGHQALGDQNRSGGQQSYGNSSGESKKSSPQKSKHSPTSSLHPQVTTHTSRPSHHQTSPSHPYQSQSKPRPSPSKPHPPAPAGGPDASGGQTEEQQRLAASWLQELKIAITPDEDGDL